MRREVLAQCIERIASDIVASGVISIIRDAVRERQNEKKAEISQVIMRVFQDYTIRTMSYTDNERSIMEILKINSLLKHDFWGKLIDGEDTPEIYNLHVNIKNTVDITPNIIGLIINKENVLGSIESAAPDIARIVVIIAEDNGLISKPKRIVSVIEAVNLLYEVQSKIIGHEIDDLVVVSCDSGSDKSFDFLGFAKCIQGVKEIFIGMWDRIVFHRHDQAKAGIEVIAATLPVFAQISELETAGTVGPELAELLRRKVIQGCGKILDAGIMIPEMSEHGAHSPRALMAPERKLLSPPLGYRDLEASEIEEQKAGSAEGIDKRSSIGEAEVDELKKRLLNLEKSMRQGKTKTKNTRLGSEK